MLNVESSEVRGDIGLLTEADSGTIRIDLDAEEVACRA
jgi:hypothetical protein